MNAGKASLVVASLASLVVAVTGCQTTSATVTGDQAVVELPAPVTEGEMPLESALAARRSVREYGERDLTWREVGQLLWAAQGITSDSGLRTAPSAGALYPLELYVVRRDGVYHYDPHAHTVTKTVCEDRHVPLGDAALRQASVYQAPVVFVVAVRYDRTEVKYGDRAGRYVKLEAGHAAQNLLLQATALGLGAVPIGAFYDERVKAAVGLPEAEEPLYVIPVGAMPD